ncbi:MAG: twin-arginine translocation signal domain-containing protein [Candidatus Sulfobium sp.]
MNTEGHFSRRSFLRTAGAVATMGAPVSERMLQ